jgi:hypothetical protein
LITRKTDINSIFPIIINIIKLNFEVVNKFLKSISLIPYISEVDVLVIVRIDNLNDFSKLILSTIKILERINKLIKKEIKIKKEILTLSFVILVSELKIFLLIILFGLTNLIISAEAVFNSI